MTADVHAAAAQANDDDLFNEIKFLRWFYENCDFGPAHSDVILIMQESFLDEDPDNVIPEGYKYE